jgi:hypothetical protein
MLDRALTDTVRDSADMIDGAAAKPVAMAAATSVVIGLAVAAPGVLIFIGATRVLGACGRAATAHPSRPATA